MKLLTVTCDRDFEETIMQARSIEKYLAPTHHFIVINNTTKNEEEWTSALIPFYKNHTVEFKFSTDYTNLDGWISQQMWKIKAVEILDDDYVILDAKNFFVKHTDISSWTQHGSGKIQYIYDEDFPLGDRNWFRTSLKYTMFNYCKELNVEPLDKMYNVITPFVVKKDIMTEVNKYKDILHNKFNNDKGSSGHSEFLLYAVVMKKLGIPLTEINQEFSGNGSGITIFGKTISYTPFNEFVNLLTLLKCYTTSGIHRDWINKANFSQKIEMLNWLTSLDIIVPEFRNKLFRRD